jgi:hypothetical protein
LETQVGANKTELDDTLARLVRARLLHRDEVMDEIAYELAHEYLIKEIAKWISQPDLELKQAEELLARAMKNWRVHHILIPEQQLSIIYHHRALLMLNDDECDCLLRSALEEDFAVGDWTKLTGEIGVRCLVRVLSDEVSSNIRRGAARALGQIGGPRTVEPLSAALKDKDAGSSVHEAVIEALGQIGDPRAVEPLSTVLKDKDAEWSMRQAAVEALEAIKAAQQAKA